MRKIASISVWWRRQWRRSLIAKSLQTIPAALLKGTIFSFIVGFVLLVLGIRGDSNGWWNDRPFLVNVISGLTGACFGIPLVLVVLNRISETVSMQAERQSVLRLAATSCSDLSQAISNGYGDMLTWVTTVNQLQEAARSIYNQAQSASELQYGSEEYQERVYDWHFIMSRTYNNYFGKIRTFFEVKNWGTIAAEWQAVKILSPRLRELGCSWITPTQEYEFDMAVVRPESIRNPDIEARLRVFLAPDNASRLEPADLEGWSRLFGNWLTEIANQAKTVLAINYEMISQLSRNFSEDIPFKLQYQLQELEYQLRGPGPPKFEA